MKTFTITIIFIFSTSLIGCASNTERQAVNSGAVIGALLGNLANKGKSNNNRRKATIIAGLIGVTAGAVAGEKLNDNRVMQENRKKMLLTRLSKSQAYRDKLTRDNQDLKNSIFKIKKLVTALKRKESNREYLRSSLSSIKSNLKKEIVRQNKLINFLNKEIDFFQEDRQLTKQEKQIVDREVSNLEKKKREQNSLLAEVKGIEKDLNSFT